LALKLHNGLYQILSCFSLKTIPNFTGYSLGRETTPTPNAPQRIPREVWDRFEGKTREDLIETVVQLQSQLESQGKRQVELEDYLDSLLMKVMARNPDLLQKSLSMMPASKLTPSIK
jgi:hypothetical protein